MLKYLLSQIDLVGGQLDSAANSITYPARYTLITTARRIVKLRREGAEVPAELTAKLASLKALDEAFQVIFLLKPLDMTARFVMGVEDISEEEEKSKAEAEVMRDIEVGRISTPPSKAAFYKIVDSRRELLLARRLENAGLLEDSLDVIDASASDFDEDLLGDVTERTIDKIAQAAVEAKAKIERDMSRAFVPARFEQLQAIAVGLDHLLSSLGLSPENLEKLRERRREQLRKLLGW